MKLISLENLKEFKKKLYEYFKTNYSSKEKTISSLSIDNDRSNLLYTVGDGIEEKIKMSMTGAADDKDGSAGFVPKPGAEDADKFLKGNGNWETIPTATAEDAGLIKTGYNEDASGKNYPVKMSGEHAYVHVPWENTESITPVFSYDNVWGRDLKTVLGVSSVSDAAKKLVERTADHNYKGLMLGDYLQFNVSFDGRVYNNVIFEIVGFDHYSYVNDIYGRNVPGHIVFLARDYITSRKIHSGSINTYFDSEVDNQLENGTRTSIETTLGISLKATYIDIDNNSLSRSRRAFIPSVVELIGNRPLVNYNGYRYHYQRQFALMSLLPSRISCSTYLWTRTPSDSGDFFFVGSYGSVDTNYYSYSYGVRPAFVL